MSPRDQIRPRLTKEFAFTRVIDLNGVDQYRLDSLPFRPRNHFGKLVAWHRCRYTVTSDGQLPNGRHLNAIPSFVLSERGLISGKALRLPDCIIVFARPTYGVLHDEIIEWLAEEERTALGCMRIASRDGDGNRVSLKSVPYYSAAFPPSDATLATEFLLRFG